MGSLTVTSAVFGACLGACHLLMWMIGRNKRFWTQVDYFWLGAAALALVTATGSVRQSMARDREWWDRVPLDAELDGARSWAASSLRFFETSAFVTTEPSNAKEAEVARQFKSAGDFYRDVVAALQTGRESRPWLELSKRPFLNTAASDTVVEQDLRHLRRIIARLTELDSRLASTRAAAQPSGLEGLYLMVWPWLLSVALALRITKVTAELRGYTKE
jgi:tetrahydromethanopterin S-methyltransferase subunit F